MAIASGGAFVDVAGSFGDTWCSPILDKKSLIFFEGLLLNKIQIQQIQWYTISWNTISVHFKTNNIIFWIYTPWN